MTSLERVLFALRFAWTDLYRRWRSFRVTLVNLISVLALVGCAVVAYGLVQGTDRRQIDQFRKDPLAGCLVFGQAVTGVPLTAGDVETLAGAIRGAVGPGHVRAAAGFSRVVRDCVVPGTNERPGFEGRTFADSDPLLDSFRDGKYWLGGRPAGPVRGAVVIGEEMMTRLGLAAGGLPAQLHFHTGGGLRAVPLAGVLKKGVLPGRYDFLMPEEVRDELASHDRVVRVPSLQTGVLPPAWADLPAPPPPVLAFFKSKGIQFVGRKRVVGGWRWTLAHQEGAGAAPPLRVWEERLGKVAAELQKVRPVGPEPAAAFARPDPLDEVTDSPRRHEPQGFFRVAVYLSHPDDLDPAITAAEEHGYELEDDRNQQIRRIRKITARILKAGDAVLAFLAVLALYNICAIQALQAQRKLPEVGMLKAIGMPAPMLLLVYLFEALLLWLPGTALGLAAGWYLGRGAERWLSADDPEAALAFAVPTERLAFIVFGSLLVCLLSTLVAAWWALRKSPLDCLTES